MLNRIKTAQDYIWMLLLLILSFYRYITYFLTVKNSPAGFPVTEDSIWYLDYARQMLHNFSLGTSVNDILYLGYNMLLVALLAICKSPQTVLFAQVITTSLGVVLIYQIALMLFNRTTALLAGLMYAFSLDLNIWTVYLLSDSFFTTLLLLNTFLWLKYFQTDKRVYKIFAWLGLVWLMLFRPNGIITVLFLAPYILHNTYGFARLWRLIKKYSKQLTLLVASGFIVLAFLLYSGKLSGFCNSFHFNIKLLLYNVYAKGWIYDISTPYDHQWRPNYTIIGDYELLSFVYYNWPDILIMMKKKALAFLGYWVVYSNPIYKLSMFIFSIPTIFFAIGTLGCIIERKFDRASILYCIIASVFIFCVIFFIDNMYRYRLPAMPAIYIITAYGIYYAFETVYVACRKLVKTYI